MIDTDKYENMRLLFLDFIDTASDEVDEEAWKDKLTMIDELLTEVKQARDIVPKLSKFIGKEIPWIENDIPECNGVFIGDAVEWNYDESGEWVLVNYNETRWVTMSYIEVRNTPKYREQVGLKEEEE